MIIDPLLFSSRLVEDFCNGLFVALSLSLSLCSLVVVEVPSSFGFSAFFYSCRGHFLH